MKRLILLLAASALTAAPALAQHQGHHMPAPAKPAAKKPVAKKPAPKKKVVAKKKPVAKKKAGATKAAPKPAPDPHAGHAMPEGQPQAAEPHAGHAMPEAADPHAGHVMPEAADPHAGHDMSGQSADIPVAPPPPAALSGPAHAADALFGAEVMAEERRKEAQMHGGARIAKLLVERAEARIVDGRDGYALDAQAWYGGDTDKLWLKGEAEGTWGKRVETIEGQALWSHAIGPFFDLQAGVRYDLNAGPDRAHAVLGVQGLAPYWFEVDGALFLSNKGELTARAEGEYDLRITQELILQPRAELDLSAQKVRELGLGSGLTAASLGLRLRYEFTPQFAPYVGVEYERAFGATARYRRAEGEKRGALAALVGLRFWF
jgi:copper resistance protein B